MPCIFLFLELLMCVCILYMYILWLLLSWLLNKINTITVIIYLYIFTDAQQNVHAAPKMTFKFKFSVLKIEMTIGPKLKINFGGS